MPARRAGAAEPAGLRRPDREPDLAMSLILTEHAPAKVNLTLHVRGRATDGFHQLESLVTFAAVGDGATAPNEARMPSPRNLSMLPPWLAISGQTRP